MSRGSAKGDRYEVVVVRYGSRSTRRGDVFLAASRPDAEIGMDYYFWVLRGRDRTVLVDTGFSAEVGVRRGRTLLADPVELFARLGVGPESAPTIVITHAHYDHLGNLAAFPASRVVISRSEFEFWSGPLASRGDFAALTEREELDALLLADREGRIDAIEGECELFPGILLIPAGGHTPGQIMVRVETHEGPVLLTSDVLHYDEELETDAPFPHFSDLPELYRAFDVVRAARDAGTVVLAGHQPGVIERFHRPVPGLEEITAVVGPDPDAPLERTQP